ncbi:MAG: PAS domain-containing protein, partial [Planctomycetota bacterium]
GAGEELRHPLADDLVALQQHHSTGGGIGLGVDEVDDVPDAATRTLSPEVMHSLVQNTPSGLLLLTPLRDDAGHIIDFIHAEANPAACRMVLLQRDEIVGQRMTQLFPGTTTDGLFEIYREVAETGETWTAEVHYGDDRLTGWYEVTAVPAQDGVAVMFVETTGRHFEAATARAARDQLATFINHTPAAVAVFDHEMRYLAASHRWYSDYNLQGQDIIGRSHYDVFTDIPQEWKDIHQRVIAGETLRCAEDRFDRADGTTIFLHWDLHPWHDEATGTNGLIMFTEVITERVSARRQLEQLSRRFERAVRGSSDGLWDWNLQTEKVWLSPRFRELLGLPPDADDPNADEAQDPGVVRDAIKLARLLNKNDLQAVKDAVENHIKHNKPYHVQFRLRHADGRDRWFLGRGQCEVDDDGNPTRMAGSITDITERRYAERRLNASLTASQVGMWEWDMLTDVTHFSDTWFTMLGYEPNELPHTFQTWADLVHPDELDGAQQAIRDHLDGKTDVYAAELRMRHKKGHWHWIATTGSVIDRDDDGNPTVLHGVHFDISKLKQTEAQLTAARDEAQAASDAKGDFIANVSHEVRTPMTAILGFTDLMADEHAPADERRAHAAIVRRNGQHLLHVLNDILDLSKIEAGRLAIENLPTDPADIVRDVAAVFAPRAAKKQIALNVEIDADHPSAINSDPTRLQQIIANLVSNAVKFTDEGSVTVRAGLDPADHSRIRIEVADTGIGLEPEHIDRVFKPFNQADTSTTRKFGGSGLGLAIARRLANLLGGDLTVRSTPGQGSTFTATVAIGSPADADPHTPQPATTSHTPADSRHHAPLSARVLLAEDAPDTAKLIAAILARAGADVHHVVNGQQATEAALEAFDAGDPFHVVLMDMQMPIVDGFTAAADLRSRGYPLPIIALTADPRDETAKRCLDVGCDHFATKPIHREKLLELVRMWASTAEPIINQATT